MKKNNFILEKIPLNALIKLLINAYEGGADFIDIIQVENEKNTIGLVAKESYYRIEPQNENEEDNNENNKFCEEDINQLIV